MTSPLNFLEYRSLADGEIMVPLYRRHVQRTVKMPHINNVVDQVSDDLAGLQIHLIFEIEAPDTEANYEILVYDA